MADTTLSLPLVIQQSGDVSRMQAVAQHASEHQQLVATAEALRRQNHERSSVQGAEAASTHNRVSSEDRPDPGPRQDPRQGRRDGGKRRHPEDDPEGAGTVLDLVV